MKYTGTLEVVTSRRIFPRSFPAYISRAHACHGKIRSDLARVRSKVEKVSSGGNSFIASFLTVFTKATPTCIYVSGPPPASY